MDFSNLLAQEIRKKRKSTQPQTALKRKLQHVKTDVQDNCPDDNDSQKELGVENATKAADNKPGESSEPPKKQLDEYLPDIQHVYNQQQLKESETPALLDKQEIADGKHHDKIATQCRKFIKNALISWDDEAQLLANSQQSRALLDETKRDFVPLLYSLRVGSMDPDLLTSLATTLYYLQTNDVLHAKDAYMKLSLGNVVWPIGIIGVGVREGSSTKHASIMINDTTRRWITAIKRLITRKEQHVT